MARGDFAGAVLEVDVEATRAAYAGSKSGGADECIRAPCRTYLLVRDKAIPETLRAALEAIGIDAFKEVEAPHIGLGRGRGRL